MRKRSHSEIDRGGLDPTETRIRSRLTLTWEQVLAQFKERRRRGAPLGREKVYREDRIFFSAVRRHFGDYYTGLRTAGIDPRSVRLHVLPFKLSDARRLVREVQRLASLPAPKRRTKWVQLKREHGSLAKSKWFGSWQKVFAKAGVAREKFIAPAYLDRDSVLLALRERMKRGLPVNAAAVQRADLRLYQSARRFFGPYAVVSRLLGQPGRKPKSRRYPDKASAVAALKLRLQRRQRIASRAILADDNALYHAVVEFLGSFEAMYVMLGQPNPGAPRYPSRRAVLEEMERRRSRGLSIRAGAMNRENGALYHAARRHFGTVEQALAALERRAGEKRQITKGRGAGSAPRR